MPDNLDRSSYVIEYAKSGRSTCNSCHEMIGKGDLRFGSVKLDDGKTGCDRTFWRCFPGCMTSGVAKNVARKMGDCTAIGGFYDLELDDQADIIGSFNHLLNSYTKLNHKKEADLEIEEEEEELTPITPSARVPRAVSTNRPSTAAAATRAQPSNPKPSDFHGQEIMMQNAFLQQLINTNQYLDASQPPPIAIEAQTPRSSQPQASTRPSRRPRVVHDDTDDDDAERAPVKKDRKSRKKAKEGEESSDDDYIPPVSHSTKTKTKKGAAGHGSRN